MSELTGQLVARTGNSSIVAEKAGDTFPDFDRNGGPAGRIQSPIAHIPSSEFPGTASNRGGDASRRVRPALDMGKIQNVAGDFLRIGRDGIGAGRIRQIAGTPKLRRFA